MKPDDWFAAAGPGVSDTDRNSAILPFVDAEEYFADLRAEVEATTASGQICWIGFDVALDVQMPRAPDNHAKKPLKSRPKSPADTTWWQLLEDASRKREVPIRALLNLHPAPRPVDHYLDANLHTVEKLNSLPTAAAIN